VRSPRSRAAWPWIAALVALPALAAPEAAPERVYRVDPDHSTAGFTLDSTWHLVHGSGARLEGELRISGQEARTLRLDGEVRAPASQLVTGNDRRDRKMHQETLAVEEHPYIRFHPSGIVGEQPEGLQDDGREHGLVVAGRLEVRGAARPVEVPVTVRFTPGRVLVDGTIEIPFLEFGVPDPSFFLARVEKVVHAVFHLEAVLDPAGVPTSKAE